MNLIDYKGNDIKFIEVYGLRRSGNHAILSWLINNFNTEAVSSVEPTPLIAPVPELGFIAQYLGNVIHINDVGDAWALTQGNYLKGLIDAYVSIGIKTIILSYEDRPYTNSFFNMGYSFLKESKKIIITRDIKNIIASRLKNSKNIGLAINRKLIDTWIENENSDNLKIRYESWLTSKEYRDSIALKLNTNNKDIIDLVSTAAGGSSFKDQSTGKIDKDKLLNRYKLVEFSREIEDLLNLPELVNKRNEIGYK